MRKYELIAFNYELLKRLDEAGVKPSYYQYLELYAEYSLRISRGEKVSYAVVCLAEKYSISERKVYALIKLFREEVHCNFGTVE